MSHCPHGKWCHVGFCRVDQGLILYNNVINDLDDGMQCVLIKSANNSGLEAAIYLGGQD